MISAGRVVSRTLEKTGSYKALLRWNAWQQWHFNGEELKLLPRFVDQRKTAIDIGAADGVYSYYLSKLAARCITFEPNPNSCARLRAAFGDRIELHEAAVSGESGTASLRIPVVNGVPYNGWGTISGAAFTEIQDCETATIPVRKVKPDDMNLGEIGFIKIDVEGHELSVLSGISSIMKESKPAILIELRDYDGTTDEAKSVFNGLGYKCAFSNGINYLFQPTTCQ